jgi:DNA repair ATPase RecN
MPRKKTLPLKGFHATNFQSLEKVDVTFGRVTAIVGDSDVGKSSFLRAYLAFMTEGDLEDTCRVGARDSGICLEGAKATIRYDGKAYSLGRKGSKKQVSREEACKLLGLPVIQAAKDLAFTPNLAPPLAPPFLILERPADAARILGSFTEVGRVQTALRETQKLKKNLEKERGGLEKRRKELEEELEGHSETPARRQRAQEFKEDLTELERLGARYQKLQGLARGRLTALKGVEEAEEALRSLPTDIPGPEDLKDLERLTERLQRLQGARESWGSAQHSLGAADQQHEEAQKALAGAQKAAGQIPIEAGEPCPFSQVALPEACVTKLKEAP